MKRKTHTLSAKKDVIMTLTELGKGVVALDFGDVEPDVNDPKTREWMQSVVGSLAKKAAETGQPLRVIHAPRVVTSSFFSR
jgi:hypothetical protein